MTQSDDIFGRDAGYCDTRIPKDGLTGEQSGSHPAENEETTRGGGGFDRSNERPPQPESTRPFNETEMGSTDSASSTHGGGSSCGLVSSLFPNSCRGRAESFARRLHRRLTSLGGDSDSSDDDGRLLVNNSTTETSWLHAPTDQRTMTSAPSNSATSLSTSLQAEERVLECQPHRSPESDIYYDFDLNSEDRGSAGTISPAEMSNTDDLVEILVNPRILKSNHHEACHCSSGPRPPDSSQNSESGYVFASPLAGLSPDTDHSEAYLDPESSDTEKSRAETFFDPQGTSESDAASNTSSGAVASKICKLSGRQRADCGQDSDSKNMQSNDNSESSSSPCNADTLESTRPPGIPVGCNSEDSINGESSLETTSPSHESLWSTFDDSTMSLQDESPSVKGCNYSATLSTRLTKSHSDSEIPVNSGVHSESFDEVDFVKSEYVSDKKTSCLTNRDKNVSTLPAICNLRRDGSETVEPSIAGLSLATKNDYSTSNSIRILESLTPECLSDGKLSTFEKESVEKHVNLRIGDLHGNEDTSRPVERLALSPNVVAIVDDVVDEEEGKNNEKSTELEEKADNDEKKDEEETEEEDDRPQRLRRCSSLKTGKTPPGTPGRKKIVRFADVLGLDLADVRTFLDEIPKIPNSAYSDLIYDEAFQKDSSPVNFWGTGPATFTTPLFAATIGPKGPMGGAKFDRILVPLFQQPGGLLNFLDLVRERQVCLENVVVHDPVTMCLRGTVRVRNLDFHKSVHVRYSLNSWRNFSDLQATYAVNSCDGFSDKFTFVLYCHTLKVGQKLELAVRFQCKGTQYWDNNAGINYCFQCLPATLANPASFIPIIAPATGNSSNHEWSPTFY